MQSAMLVLSMCCLPGQPDAEDKALAAIVKLGGSFERDKAPGSPVVAVTLKGDKVRDFDLAWLAALPKVRSLSLAASETSDAGLKQLANSPLLDAWRFEYRSRSAGRILIARPTRAA